MKILVFVFSIAWIATAAAVLEYTSENPRCSLYIALNLQRQNDEFTDVVFRTSDGRNTSAHRIVLVAASPIFKQLLEEAAERGHPDEEFEMLGDEPAKYEEADDDYSEGSEVIVKKRISKVVKTIRTRITSSVDEDYPDAAGPTKDAQKPVGYDATQQQQIPQKPGTGQQKPLPRQRETELDEQQIQKPLGTGQEQKKPSKPELAKITNIEVIRPPKGQYCDCYKLTIEVPQDCDTMDAVLDTLYTGKANITDLDAAITALLDFQIDKPAEELAEKHFDELKPPTVKKVLTKVKETLKKYKDNTVVETILKKVKKRKDLDKIAKDLPPKTFIEYLEDKEMTPEFATETVVNWLETADATNTSVEPEELETILDVLDLEKMNCTELAKFTDILSHSKYDPRKVLQKIMDMSLRGTGRCHSACGECLREYLYHMKFHYEPGVWNASQQLKPQSVAGLEANLGSFFIGSDEFTAAFQRDASADPMNSCVDGFVLYKHGLKGLKGSSKSSEYDMEIAIDPKGKGTKDCPLRNRLRYKFDDKTNIYKWNTRLDFNQPQDIYIKMNPVK